MSGALPSRTRTAIPGCSAWKLASSPGRSTGPGRQHRPERHRALEQAAQGGEVGADRVGAGDDLARPLEHDLAGLGQLDAAARPPQQREPQLRLQPPDRLRHGRLREMQLLGRARERPRVRDVHEGAQLPELHARHRRGSDPQRCGDGAIAHRHCRAGRRAPTVGAGDGDHGQPLGGHVRDQGAAGELLRDQRRLPLPRAGVRGAALRARRGARRGLAADRLGGADLRRLAASRGGPSRRSTATAGAC